MKLAILLCISYIFFGCTFLEEKKAYKLDVERTFSDTIFVKTNLLNEPCENYKREYFQQFGIVISKYYSVRDRLIFTQGNETNYFIVLSPLNLDVEFDCYSDTLTGRLLVHINNKDGKSKVVKIYDNLISNVGGLMNNFVGISKEKNDIKIIHQSGVKYNYSYEMILSFEEESLFLKKIIKKCSVDDKSIRNEYKYNVKNIEINILDSLNVNCNCNNDWNKLENRSSN